LSKKGGEGVVVCGRVKERTEGEIIKSICGNLKFQPGSSPAAIGFIIYAPCLQTGPMETHLPDKS